jgi:chromosomal replication initiation ATPase DnaA
MSDPDESLAPEINFWDQLMERLSEGLPAEEFRRWFSTCSYASDSGDQVTVWVASEPVRRHIMTHYLDRLDREKGDLGRPETHIRFLVAGYGEEDED